jgi:Domain of unknown function (DUF1833)
MPRALSTATLAAMMSEETGEAWLELLTLDHPSLDEPIRVTSDGVETVSRGHTFLPYPFDIQRPDSTEDRPPRARLSIDNVDPVLITALRPLTSPIAVTYEVVRGAAPDELEWGVENLEIREIQYDSLTITGELVARDLRVEAFPRHLFVPSLFPGLF